MSELFHIFPIPVYCNKAEGTVFDDIQKELKDTCDKLEFSQVKHWTRDTHELNLDPFERNLIEEYELTHFKKFITEGVEDYLKQVTEYDWFPFIITNCWVTKTKKGHYAHEHHHGYADISGVYYLNTNGEDGNLQFDQIHSNMSGNFVFGTLPSKQAAPLENGLLMLWPGPLKHGTQTNNTDNERISFSFNILLARPGFPYKEGAFTPKINPKNENNRT
tara:strand:+ start:271 stop:927 length:657 start_codon:yes stop_codon:yes gene_type:complete